MLVSKNTTKLIMITDFTTTPNNNSSIKGSDHFQSYKDLDQKNKNLKNSPPCPTSNTPSAANSKNRPTNVQKKISRFHAKLFPKKNFYFWTISVISSSISSFQTSRHSELSLSSSPPSSWRRMSRSFSSSFIFSAR